MSALVAGELLKLRTTRTFFGITGAALGIVLLIVGLTSALVSFDAEPEALLSQVSSAGLVQIFALVIGILAVSTEFRHGTITTSLLTAPDRTRYMASKLLANGAAGLLLGLAASLGTLVLTAVIFALRDIDGGTSAGDLVRTVAGNTIACGLFAALGVGVGAVMRNQAGAIVAALVYLLLVESLLRAVPGLDDVISTYGLNGVSSALTAGGDEGALGGSDDPLGQVPAALIFAAYAAVFAVAGTWLLRRRDVTAD